MYGNMYIHIFKYKINSMTQTVIKKHYPIIYLFYLYVYIVILKAFDP